SSFSTDTRWLPQIFAAWDRYSPNDAFPEFPLLTHFAVPSDLVGECISRASQMVAGRGLTDRTWRCAGKLLEGVQTTCALLVMLFLAYVTFFDVSDFFSAKKPVPAAAPAPK
ncbi:MAG: hypothetical protein WCL08_08555, partial [Verrucomicrobiota bacterium]